MTKPNKKSDVHTWHRLLEQNSIGSCFSTLQDRNNMYCTIYISQHCQFFINFWLTWYLMGEVKNKDLLIYNHLIVYANKPKYSYILNTEKENCLSICNNNNFHNLYKFTCNLFCFFGIQFAGL